MANTTNYIWVGPSGSHIQVGGTVSSGTSLTTTAVNVNFGNTSGIVKVRANNSCGNGTYKKITVNFTCREDEIDVTISNGAALVYPNPTSDKLNITMDAEANSTLQLTLTDMAGRKVVAENHIANEGRNSFGMDLSKLTKGIYLLEINNGMRIQKTKVVVK